MKDKCKKYEGLTIVIIPAQVSDHNGIYAPKVGDYKNTIVKYLADGYVYAYDKDGNYTLISILPML